MCLTRLAHLDLKFPISFLQYACCNILFAICILQRAIYILQCNTDFFLLNEIVLVLYVYCGIKFRNKHIACRNMHIARESILRLTHARDLARKLKQYNTIFYGESILKIFVALP